MRNCWLQKAIYLPNGWNNNGIWPWPFRTWSIPCDNRGKNRSRLGVLFCIQCEFFFIFLFYISEDGSSHAGKWNWVVPRCRVFIYSSS
ncbi:unnamed protein product [Brassica oleracea]|uniref:(rape) hypothetical protein n=1 Tax=Brassica napus TaxID=3708 RepID=A0A816QAZ2_BRANA|nr:unnamed protein product [Brassica napus]